MLQPIRRGSGLNKYGELRALIWGIDPPDYLQLFRFNIVCCRRAGGAIHMKFNVLLVEDNTGFRRTLADALLSHFTTMHIEEVDNGEDAEIKVEALQPDMIFMDINLPGENGLKATRKIKTRNEQPLIVILTSYDIPEYRQQAFRNGADYFISKADSSCLRDIIAWVEKAVADKNTRSGQNSTSAIGQASGPIVSRFIPNIGIL